MKEQILWLSWNLSIKCKSEISINTTNGEFVPQWNKMVSDFGRISGKTSTF